MHTGTYGALGRNSLSYFRRALIIALSFLLVAPGVFTPFAHEASAAVYTKTWTSQNDFEKNTPTTNTPTIFNDTMLDTKNPQGNLASPDTSLKLKTWGANVSESFDSNINNDVAKTTANWDTGSGNVTVPAAQSVTSEQLDKKLGGVYGGSEVIQSNIAIGSKTYLGLNNGKLLVYDSSSGETTELTGLISSFWQGYTFNAFLYDSTGGYLYMAGPYGRFARLSIPGQVATNLNSRISSFWYYGVNTLTLDTSGRRLYLGGDNGLFARFDLDGDVATPPIPAEDLRSKIQFWLTYPITALEYENGHIYITGQWGFAMYDIASGTTTSLNDKLGGTYGSANNNNAVIGIGQDVFIGSDEGVFLKYNHATGATQDLSANIRANFVIGGNAYAIRKFAYDSTNGDLIIGGDQGRLVRYDIAANAVVADLSAAMSGWIQVSALAFSPSTNEVYVGGSNSSRLMLIRSNNTYADLSSQVSAKGANEVLGLTISNGKVFISAGTYALYYDIALNQTFSLTEKMNDLYGATVPNITATAIAGDIVYQGTANGKLLAYNNTTGVNSDITSRISLWGGYPIYTMLNVNGMIYMGSYSGRFMRFDSTNSSAGENLSGAVVSITDGWRYIYELTYDSTQGEIYLAGPYTFGSYRISDGRATNRRTGLDQIVGNSYFNTGGMAYNPSDNKIYLGSGDYGSRYFVYDMNFVTATESEKFTELTGIVSVYMSNYPITDIAYAPDINEMIVAGYYGKLVAHNVTGGTAANLSFNTSDYWGWNQINKIWYSGNRGTGGIFVGGTGGKFAQLRWSGPGVPNWRQYNLSSYISSAWSTWTMNAISGAVGTNIFLVGDSGRFVRYDYATNGVLPLTATYNAFFPCTERFMSAASDATGRVFFGSAGGKLAIAAASLIITNETASLTGWGSTPVNQMAYSNDQSVLFVAGSGGKVNYIDYNPATTNTAGELGSAINSFWGSNEVRSVTAFSLGGGDVAVYAAGSSGQFAYIFSDSSGSALTFTGSNRQPNISKYLRVARYFYKAEYVPASPASIYIASQQTNLVRFDIASQTATILDQYITGAAQGITRFLYFNNSTGVNYLYFGGDGGYFSRITHGTTTVEGLKGAILGYWSSFILYDVSVQGSELILTGERTRFGGFNVTTGIFSSRMLVLGGYISFYGNVLAMAVDTANNRLYIGLDGGRLGRLDPTTSAQAEDLTGYVAAYWGANAVRSLLYVGGAIYASGDNASLVKLSNLSQPTITVNDLKAGLLAAGWLSYGTVYDMAYRPAGTGTIYLAGNYSLLAAYSISGNAFNGMYRDRVAGNSPYCGWNCTIYSVSYESNANAVYVGGYYVFGRFSVGAGTVENLYGSVSPFIYAILDMATSMYSGDVYIGGYSGQFGKYAPTGAATDLSTSFRNAFGSQTMYAMSYDDDRKALYLGGSYFFGKHDTVSDVSMNFTSLSQLGSTNVYAVAYVPSVQMAYMGGQNFLRRTTVTRTYYAVSTVLSTTPFPIGWATITSNYILGTNGFLFYQLSNDGGASWRTFSLGSQAAFSSGDSQLIFRIVLDMNPTVYDLAINYGGYYPSASLSGVLINAYSPTTWQNIVLNYSLNGQPALNYRFRTANTRAALSVQPWSGIGSVGSSGAANLLAGNGVYLEVEIILNSRGTNTPIINSFSITYDTPPAPPLVEITKPPGPISTARAAIEVLGIAADPSGIQSVRWSNSLTSETGNATGLENWSVPALPLAIGTNRIRVTARDNENIDGFAEILIERLEPDVNLPVVTITSPTVNPLFATTSTPIRLGGTATDDRGVIDMMFTNEASGRTGSVSLDVGTGVWASDPIILNDGPNNIIISAFDDGGNEGVDNVSASLVPSIGIDVVNIKYVPGYINNMYGHAWSSNTGWISFGCYDGAPDGSPVCKYSNYGASLAPHPTDPSKILIKGYGWMGNDEGSVIPPATLGP
ncbi:MAG: hypothetical protein WC289_03780 [Patescibacteria group bacterium]|jgi:hypothetical protein